jgi:hypothetical protein
MPGMCTLAPGPCTRCLRCSDLYPCACGRIFDPEDTLTCPGCGQKYHINKGWLEPVEEGESDA